MTSEPIKTVLVARSRQAVANSPLRLRALCQSRIAFVPGRKEERFETDLAIAFEGGEGVAHNVSANGIYFVTDAALQVGQSVKLRLEFAHFPGGPIAANCVARVVRVQEQGASRGVGASIASFEFHRIAPGKSSNYRGSKK